MGITFGQRPQLGLKINASTKLISDVHFQLIFSDVCVQQQCYRDNKIFFGYFNSTN